MANHQSGRKKLNMRDDHRRALLRNQAIFFIKNGCLQTTRVRVKEVQKIVEKLVTAVRGVESFNAIRKARQVLPYELSAVKKLVYEIAPRYTNRPGGYTRVLLLGTRASDTAKIARLEWVQDGEAAESTAAPVAAVANK